MGSKRGRGLLAAIVILGLLGALGYTAYAGAAVYQDMDRGGQALVAAQRSMSAATGAADPAQLQGAATQLKLAEQDFSDAGRRSSNDPALRLVGGIPGAGRQLDASTHLAAIGADISRAGEGAAAVAIQVAALEQKYAGRALTPDDLQSLLQQAQGIAADYSASTKAIGQQLRAARGERAQVNPADLVGPLKDAYNEVDLALAEADTAFLRYQDVRRVLSDFLGLRLPN
ncbi:MAG TPA: hypothetical protein VGR77_09430 [Candidatus Dormibacteraeota bacterium]|nr:hypothetical protein [Candidatus Dormibacteraeota bacterium]